MIPYPSKINALTRLKNAGLHIGTVIDVGVHEHTPELIQAFPDKHHLLFEPADDFHQKISENYAQCSWELVPKAVSNHDGSGQLKKFDIDGGGTSHSTLIGGSSHSTLAHDPSTGTSEIDTVRLDTFLKGRNDQKPYLLKIDVDGYELPILESIGEAAGDIACIIIEATRETFVERLNAVTNLGFELIDIIDTCYYHGIFSQSDLIFVSKEVYKLADMQPWKTKDFSWSHWVPVASLEGAIQR